MKIKIDDVFKVLQNKLDIFSYVELKNVWKVQNIDSNYFINKDYSEVPFEYVFGLWKKYYPKTEVEDLKNKIYDFECIFWANSIYENFIAYDWRQKQIKLLIDLERRM